VRDTEIQLSAEEMAVLDQIHASITYIKGSHHTMEWVLRSARMNIRVCVGRLGNLRRDETCDQ
jgi:hypothetical protein